ncbi:peroxiredoxin [Aliidiomarina minuta]|uniref:Peroxiredoxin n=1 Tax=Aliidiomarina minuta TaxID=880057 RepID=A0A432W3Y8_9GAMM|nr:TlpA disulfide reductase family protein [Aliidiomarina minuta]RUO24048.1 peroxiredoxin [Aliidiomarina minuta]
MSVTAGPFAFATQHLIFLFSCVLALAIAWWLGRRQNVGAADAVFRIIAVALISARLVFVIIYYDSYFSAPWQIFNVRDGGFNLIAGFIAGIAWGLYELRRYPLARKAIATASLGGVTAGVLLSLLFQYQIQQTEFPQASLYNLQQESVNLSQDFAGQPVVINLWASWCPPCVREMPLLEDAAAKWPEVAFLTINQGEDSELVENFLQEQGLNLPHVLLDKNSEISDAIGSYALPTTLFFDSEGRLNTTHIGEFSAATLENAVRKLD